MFLLCYYAVSDLPLSFTLKGSEKLICWKYLTYFFCVSNTLTKQNSSPRKGKKDIIWLLIKTCANLERKERRLVTPFQFPLSAFLILLAYPSGKINLAVLFTAGLLVGLSLWLPEEFCNYRFRPLWIKIVCMCAIVCQYGFVSLSFPCLCIPLRDNMPSVIVQTNKHYWPLAVLYTTCHILQFRHTFKHISHLHTLLIYSSPFYFFKTSVGIILWVPWRTCEALR